jgi:mono/diheme cytochrome c family protein
MTTFFFIRLRGACLVTALALSTPALHADEPGPSPFMAKTLKPFLHEHCVGCHNAENKKAGLDLDRLSLDPAAAKNFDVWVKVHDKVRAGEMPPGEKRRPPEKERDALLGGLRTELVQADLRRQEKDGRSVMRRLTRREYENTLRDLFDLPNLAVQDLLPEDGRAFGYDRIGTALDLSHVQLTKYLEAADLTLDKAIATSPQPPQRVLQHLRPTDRGFPGGIGKGSSVALLDKKPAPGFPILSEKIGRPEIKEIIGKTPLKADAMGILQQDALEFHPAFKFKLDNPGFYRIRISMWSFEWNKGRVLPGKQTESASLQIKNGRLLGYFDAPPFKSQVHEFVTWLVPGPEIRINAATLKQVKIAQTKGNVAEYVGPGLALDWFEVDGPLNERWPPESHRRVFGDLPLAKFEGSTRDEAPMRTVPGKKNDKKTKKQEEKQAKIPIWSVKSANPEADARRLLADFLPRAFRRPVSDKEVNRYVGLVQSQLKDKVSFEEGMRTAYKAALCSTDFLFLKQPAGSLDDWALASRLSYFLWNSMPDRTLFDLAGQGKLKEPATLRAQVDRLLKDPKAERFITDFLDQWLELRDIEFTLPDKKLYPEFGAFLRDSMVGESQAYFRELLDNDLGARHIVASDFAMLNSRLAQHYRIPGITGATFRKVPLPADSHRGGFLTQASVLRVTANGTVTSPVKRGAWVMKQIVGEPPAPPPADVPAVEPDIRGTVTIREQLAKHRNDRTCAACHAKIDPPGFALEIFDVIGGWRDRYRSLGEQGDVPDPMVTGRAKVPYLWAQPVDASGETPEGNPFKTFEEFKNLLAKDDRRLGRNLASQLTIYATGAPIGFADRDDIEQLLDRARPTSYGVRSIIHELVQSAMFRKK